MTGTGTRARTMTPSEACVSPGGRPDDMLGTRICTVLVLRLITGGPTAASTNVSTRPASFLFLNPKV
eukprot:scaffold173731_cov17-Prasinocladus_malaysianus.AAC.1